MNTYTFLLIPRARHMTLLFAIGGLSVSFVQAQSSQKAPEQHWSDVAGFASVVGIAKASNGKQRPHTEIAAEIKDQASKSRQAAAAARNFYSQFPSHPKAAEAKKIEALASLRGAETSDSTQCQAALALAKVYRDTATFSVNDRFEVALAMEQLSLSLRITNRQAADSVASWRALGDELKREFGDISGLQSYYIELARTAEATTAVDLAAQVRQSPAASAQSKAQAQVILDRAALVGKKLKLQLPQVDGGGFDLGGTRLKAVVVIAWSPANHQPLLALRQYEKTLQNIDVVLLALGSSSQKVVAAREYAPVGAIYCHAAAGASSRATITALKLQYSPLPRVYVFERAGVLLGSGHLKELPALVAKIRG